MTSRARSMLTSIGASVALLALVVGVPILLIALAGWPLPSAAPNWDTVTTAVRQADITGDTVIKLIAGAVWLIWAQVAWALGWEVAVNQPRLNRGQRPRRAPLVAQPVSTGIGRLVAVALAIGVTVLSTPSPATALPTPAPQIVSPRLTSTSASPSPRPPPGAPTEAQPDRPTWTVERHDSLWHIAELTLGDGQRFDEIVELNPSIRSPRDLRPGQVLTLPASAVVPSDHLVVTTRSESPEPSASTSPAPSTDGYVPLAHVAIQPGDTLWDLTESRLAEVDDDVTPTEIVDHLQQVIATNPHVVEDPNLIYPGEVFVFPELGTPPPPPASAPTAPPSTPAAPETQRDLDVERPPAVVRSAEQVVSIPKFSGTSAPAEPAAGSIHGVDAAGRTNRDAPWLAGVSGVTALATGLLLLYRRRLQLRAARGARAYRAVASDDTSHLIAITRAADVSLVRWANQRLAALFEQLQPDDVDGQPFAIELSEDHGIELLWTSPNAQPPAPWTTDAAGWSWRHRYDPDDPVRNVDAPSALPALVTIGTREGNQLLLNLEACGALGIAGQEPRQGEDFLRSLVVELGSGEALTDAHVLSAGVTLDGLTRLDRITVCSSAVAIERGRAASQAADEFLRTHGLESAFKARLRGDAVGRESVLMVLHQPDQTLDRLIARPGLGVSCVSTASLAAGSPTVELDGNGGAVLRPSGINFEPVSLPVRTLEIVSDLLDEASEPFDESTQPDCLDLEFPTEQIDEALEPFCHDADCGAGTSAPDAQQPEVIIRVLGEPAVLDHPEIGRIETSIAAYIACNGNSRRDEQVINAVWNGRAIEPKTLWNKMGKLRTALGADLIPLRKPKDPRVALADGVATDLSILRVALRQADEVSASEGLDRLVHALDLIEGPPFDGPTCDWAYETQDFAVACEVVENAGIRCAQIALDLCDLDAARRAISQALRALPLNEPLYRMRMRIESAGGNPEGVRQALDELVKSLDLRGENGMCASLDPETVRLSARLLRGVPPAEVVEAESAVV